MRILICPLSKSVVAYFVILLRFNMIPQISRMAPRKLKASSPPESREMAFRKCLDASSKGWVIITFLASSIEGARSLTFYVSIVFPVYHLGYPRSDLLGQKWLMHKIDSP